MLGKIRGFTGGSTGEREVQPDRDFGRWLHDELIRLVGLDDDGWIGERLRAASARLNGIRSRPALPVYALFEAEPSAFTAPGGRVYVTRGLMHQLVHEPAVAFVVAHEMAHQDLGHLPANVELPRFSWQAPAAVVSLVRLLLQRKLNQPEQETAADAEGLRLCLAAGYDRRACVRAFDVLETLTLDVRDVDGALGEDTPVGTNPVIAQARHWLWERMRGYPSVRARREALLSSGETRA